MKIVFVYGHMYNGRTWARASEILCKDGVSLIFLSQQKVAEKALACLKEETPNIFIGHLFHDLPMHGELLECSKKAGMRVGLGNDIPPGFSSFYGEQGGPFHRR